MLISRIGPGRQVDYFLSYREALCPDILSVVSRSLLWDLGKSMSELLHLGFSLLSGVHKLLPYLPLCEASMTVILLVVITKGSDFKEEATSEFERPNKN